MKEIGILLCMIFYHIVDDFYLQGILANLKQKIWWKENAPDNLYKYDYIVALIIHSISWSFMILLPVAFVLSWQISWLFGIIFIANIVIHAVVDHFKANRLKINLITDQSIHFVQIIVSWALLSFISI